jgi:hypothetical protein
MESSNQSLEELKTDYTLVDFERFETSTWEERNERYIIVDSLFSKTTKGTIW